VGIEPTYYRHIPGAHPAFQDLVIEEPARPLPDQEKLVSRLKSLVHRFEETRDLRLIGGYRQGSDPDLDMAIKQVPIIYDILKQLPDERPMADAFTDLATALKNGSAAHLVARQRG